MEVVRSQTKKRRYTPRGSKSAQLQSLISRTLKNMYNPARLQDLIEHLSYKEQANFILYMGQFMFQKPAPVKDPVDALTSKQVNEMYDKLEQIALR